MAGRGAPLGNSNATKNKVWADMIRKVATQNPEKMRKAAESLLNLCVEGDIAAMKEFGDRLDGKSKQQVELSQDADNPLFEMKSDDRYAEYMRLVETFRSRAGQADPTASGGKPTH
jgi:hypothetical protein